MRYAKSQQTRKKLLLAMSRQLRSRGYYATGLRQIVAESGIPKGSLYYHFPQGKLELTTSAVRFSSEQLLTTLNKIIRLVPGPIEAVELLCHFFIEELKRSNFSQGCPIATVTLEVAASMDEIHEVCKTGFNQMIGVFAAFLHSRGISPEKAEELGYVIISAIEGALVLSKAQRNTKPLRLVRENLKNQLTEILTQPSTSANI